MAVCETCAGTGEPLEAHEADKETRCHMCEGTGVTGLPDHVINDSLARYIIANLVRAGEPLTGTYSFTITGTIRLPTMSDDPNRLYWLESELATKRER
jgi:hypothetical protein